MSKPRKCVKVVWDDAETFGGWRSNEPGNIGPDLIDTVGWLLLENKTHICVTTSISQNQGVLDVLKIPKCSIKLLRRFKI